MVRVHAWMVLAIAWMLACQASWAADMNVSMLVGERDEHSQDLNATAFGASVDFAPEIWLVRPEIGWSGAYSLGLTFGGGIGVFEHETELSLGVVHYGETTRGRRLHIGGGVTRLDGGDLDKTDGVYVHGGLTWNVGGRASIGFDLRYASADDYRTFADYYPGGVVERPAGYLQAAAIIGWQF